MEFLFLGAKSKTGRETQDERRKGANDDWELIEMDNGTRKLKTPLGFMDKQTKTNKYS